MSQVQLSDAEREFVESCLPIGRFGPHPERLRQQFKGVIWPFRTGGQWREMPAEFGAWPTVHNRFGQWRDAGVFQALLEGSGKRGQPGNSAQAEKPCTPCWPGTSWWTATLSQGAGDQTIVIMTAAPGSEDEQKPDLLRVVGLQQLQSPPTPR
ncbi:transposase [Streptomyces apricus]|uniref:Transposase n=1 Tax=Streptomyces apricus TaxID=1828112 RepID=A0A5B0B900_9ACTN|nr:transposase [Streptomyces apricus]